MGLQNTYLTCQSLLRVGILTTSNSIMLCCGLYVVSCVHMLKTLLDNATIFTLNSHSYF